MIAVPSRIARILSSNAGSRFGSGILWNISATVATQGSLLVASIIIARRLGQEQFGGFAIIQSTLVTLTTLAQVSTGLTATKFVAELRDVDRARAGRILGLCSLLTFAAGALATCCILAGAPWLASVVLKSPGLATGLRLSAASVLFAVMNGYQRGALAGLERYRTISIFAIAIGVVHVLLCASGAALWGLDGVLTVVSVSGALSWATYHYTLRRELRHAGIAISRRGCTAERSILYGFIVPAAIAGFSSMPALWLANAFLVRQPGGYRAMGLYAAANTIRLAIMFLPVVINGVAISVINSHRGLGRIDRYQRTFSLNLRITVAVALLGALGMIVCGTWLLRAFGRDFSPLEATPMMWIMALSVPIEAAGVAVYQLVQGHGKMWSSLWLIALPRDVIIVGAAYVLTAKLAATGLAAAVALGTVVGLTSTLLVVWRLRLRHRI